MPRVHTHYDNLKVSRNAPPEVIRAAYRTLSKKYHPDLNPNNDEAKRIIQLVNAAYEILSNPTKREEHDRWIAHMETSAHRETSQGYNGTYARPHTRSQGASKKSSSSRRHRAQPGLFSSHRLIQKFQTMLDQFARYLSKKA